MARERYTRYPRRDREGRELRFADPRAGGGVRSGVLPLYSYSQRNNSSAGFSPTPEKPFPDMADSMADPNKEPPVKPVGASGVAILSGIVQSEEYNPDFYWRDAITVYERMWRNDAQVNALLMMLFLPIERAAWTIKPASASEADKEIASFVESCLFHDMVYTTTEGVELHQSWTEILQHILLMLPMGFSVFAKWWRVDEHGWVKWARWEPLLARTIWRWWTGADNQLVGVQQRTYKNWRWEFEDIHVSRLLRFTHRQQGENYDGWSVLRSAYKHWFYLDNMYKIQALGVEREATLPPIGVLGPDDTYSGAADNLLTQLQNMRVSEQMGVVITHGQDIRFPMNRQRGASEVDRAIEHHDMKIARNVLAEFLNTGAGDTGSYALALTKLDNFLDSLNAVTAYICDQVAHQAIRELVNYNFDGVGVYPELVCEPIKRTDLQTIAPLLAYLDPNHADPELQDWLRKSLGAPSAPKSLITAVNPSGPQTPGIGNDGQQGAPKAESEGSGRGQNGDTAEGAGDDGLSADTGAGSDIGDGLAELREEMWLLRESLSSFDAVERGVSWTFAGGGYDPYRDPHGKFAPGPHAEREGEGGGEHAGHASGGEHASARKGSSKGKAGKAAKSEGARGSKGERTLEQHTHEELKTQARAQGAKVGRTKGETIANIRAKAGNAEATAGHASVVAEHKAAVARREGEASSSGTTTKATGGGKAAKTPEQAHAEKVARAEAAVSKAQARFDAADKAFRAHIAGGGHVNADAVNTEHVSSGLALRRAQTRLANLRAVNPHETPAQQAHTKKSAQFEMKIAKARVEVAKREGEGEQRIQHIPLEHIHVGLNPREHFDPAKIEELAASIKEHGLLQPISVRAHQGGYQIIAGERRFRAMQALNSKTVPAIVHNVDDRKARELAIIENVNRADMRPVETAKAYGGLRDDGMSAKEIGKRLGKTEAHVQQHLDLLTLHPHLQKAVDEGRLHFGVVRDLARLTPEHQNAAAEHILSHDLGLKSSKAAIRAYQEREAQVEMFPHGMFPSVHVATQGERDAHAKYQDAIAHITQHLSKLDDETMRGMARVVPSPGRESQRLDLMAKQLRRMQKILDTAEQQRNMLSDLTDREYTRLLTLMRRDVVQLREAVTQETVRLQERLG